MSCEKKRKIGFWTWYGQKIVTSSIAFVKKLNPKAVDGEAEGVIGFFMMAFSFFFMMAFSFLPMLFFPRVFNNILDYLLPLLGTFFIGLTVFSHGLYRIEEDC